MIKPLNKAALAAKRRAEEEESKRKQRELEEAIAVQKQIEKLKMDTFQTWLIDMGVILLEDTLQVALESMHQFSSSQAFVVNVRGELIGMVTLQDICKLLINEEASAQSIAYQHLLGEADN